ncbi:CPBP family intramembrane metalloprotease [Desulfurococcaceae archaeon MEX13E-LK6-19]|nr:CPBP family intramembrane metalloprotease [Desulfurococcaceae archaeon MEX13E-LK6-19]
MSKRLTLKYLPFAWSGLVLTVIVFAILGSIVRGDPCLLLKKWGISVDVFAMTMHEIGLLLGLVVTIHLLSKRGVKISDLGMKGGLKATWIAYAVAGFVVAMLLYPAIEAITRVVGIGMFWWSEERFVYSSLMDWCLVIIVAVLLAPIVEELFFRGYLLTAFLERIGSVPLAICISSLVFASIHALIGPGAMIFIFLWSLIPSYLYLRTGSLYPAILMHALNNIFAYMIIPALLQPY